jgi:uncharacterized protein YndB with AHSA1/START domain
MAATLESRLPAGFAEGHGPREVAVTRVVDAPRELVFKAWTDPRLLLSWWAPKDCVALVCRVDLRPGGAFHYCIRESAGRDIWGIGTYREIVAPERLVYTDLFADPLGRPISPAHQGVRAGHLGEAVVTVTFQEHARGSGRGDRGGQTLLTVRQTLLEPTTEPFATRAGWQALLEQLAAELSRHPGHDTAKVVDRRGPQGT